MPAVLVCASEGARQQLAGTAVYRDGFERHEVAAAHEAMRVAARLKPRLVILERGLPSAESLVRQLRASPETRGASIVVVATGEMSIEEIGLLEAGANAVLRLPPGPDWDRRIEALLHVPTRKQMRLPVSLALQGRGESGELRGRVLNLSATGMLVECTEGMAVGGEISFRFELPGFEASSGEISGKAQVVRLAGGAGYGLAFTSLGRDEREILRRFLAAP
jgi:CheY-like chemotaxis protein